MDFKSFLKFTLSHHYSHQYNRCYKIGRLHFCARCLGLYPILLIFIFLQFYIEISPLWESVLLFLFPMPALIDWSIAVLIQNKGLNSIRTSTGFLLGLSLGRLIYLHIIHPFNLISLWGFILYTFFMFLILSGKTMIYLTKKDEDGYWY